MALFKTWMVPVVLILASLILGVHAVDPVGDRLNPTSPGFDLVECSTSFAPATLTITLTFDPASATDLEWLGGSIDFDIDQDVNTGVPSHLEIFDVQPYGPFGADYFIEFQPLGEEVELSTVSGQYIEPIGRYPVTFDGMTVTVVLPRCHTTPCEGIAMDASFDMVILLDRMAEFTDRAPNDESVIRAEPAPGDLDEDGDIDVDDSAAFSACLTGAENPPVPTECESADLDDDDDVDQTDFGLLQSAMTGPF